MFFKHIASFHEGERVPDWLITTEPREPGATQPKVTFDQDVHVVETSAGYQVINDDLRPGKTLIYADGVNCGPNTIFATGRTVILIARMTVLTGPDDDRDPRNPAPDPTPPQGDLEEFLKSMRPVSDV